MTIPFPASEANSELNFVDVSVPGWAWVTLIAFICALLAFDILVVHRKAHDVHVREAAIESTVWISLGLAFTGVVALAFGGAAAGEYVSGYLIEKSLSIDNVFVWALILSYFKIPTKYQHRVLFWGIFGALALRHASHQSGRSEQPGLRRTEVVHPAQRGSGGHATLRGVDPHRIHRRALRGGFGARRVGGQS